MTFETVYLVKLLFCFVLIQPLISPSSLPISIASGEAIHSSVSASTANFLQNYKSQYNFTVPLLRSN